MTRKNYPLLLFKGCCRRLGFPCTDASGCFQTENCDNPNTQEVDIEEEEVDDTEN